MYTVRVFGFSGSPVGPCETLGDFSGLRENHRLVTIAKRNCGDESKPALLPVILTQLMLVNLGETEHERARLRECGSWLTERADAPETRRVGMQFWKTA